VGASSITSETFGKVAHPLPGSSTETDRKNNTKGLMIFIVYSNGRLIINQRHEEACSCRWFPSVAGTAAISRSGCFSPI
jgi:hypothetical protein